MNCINANKLDCLNTIIFELTGKGIRSEEEYHVRIKEFIEQNKIPVNKNGNLDSVYNKTHYKPAVKIFSEGTKREIFLFDGEIVPDFHPFLIITDADTTQLVYYIKHSEIYEIIAYKDAPGVLRIYKNNRLLISTTYIPINIYDFLNVQPYNKTD